MLHFTFRPVSVVVDDIRLMTTAIVSSGRPRQFLLIWLNNRCSILFHFDVPGGKWDTSMGMLISLAKDCSCVFHKRQRVPLLPPPSAVIYNAVAFGKFSAPIKYHQFRMDWTANSAVSLLMPTLTYPSL